MWLNQPLSVLFLSQVLLSVFFYCAVHLQPFGLITLYYFVFFVFCLLMVMLWLSAPVLEGSCLKLPINVDKHVKPYSVTHSLWDYVLWPFLYFEENLYGQMPLLMHTNRCHSLVLVLSLYSVTPEGKWAQFPFTSASRCQYCKCFIAVIVTTN